MDRQTSKALRKYAANTDQGQHAVKRDWLKLSHKERTPMRRALGVHRPNGSEVEALGKRPKVLP